MAKIIGENHLVFTLEEEILLNELEKEVSKEYPLKRLMVIKEDLALLRREILEFMSKSNDTNC